MCKRFYWNIFSLKSLSFLSNEPNQDQFIYSIKSSFNLAYLHKHTGIEIDHTGFLKSTLLTKQISKQNINRDIEIKNKLTVTRGERDNGGKMGMGCQGTCIRDPRIKPKGGLIEGGRWGWVGQGKLVVAKWRHLYLNNN